MVPMRLAARTLPTVLLVVAAVTLSGCIGAVSIPDNLQAEASNAYAVPADWAYDGRGVRSVDGSISIDVVDSANRGTVVAEITDAGTTYEIEFDRFRQAPGSAFQDGGIVHGIFEHGDSGNGDANIPRSYAVSAGWGLGTVTRDGEPMQDPLTGDGNLSVHYMVFQGGVRDDADRAIYQEGRTGFYTPSEPGNAEVDPADREVHLLVKSTAQQPPQFEGTFEGSVAGADHSNAFDIPVQANQSVINLQVRLESAVQGVYPARLTFQLLGPNEEQVATRQMGLTLNGTPQMAGTATIDVQDPPGAGNYTLRVTGLGVNTAYTVDARVIYPTPLFLHYYFEDVQLLNVEGDIEVPGTL